LNEINYIDLIKKCFENYSEEFKKNVVESISTILNDGLKVKEIIENIYIKIFENIKLLILLFVVFQEQEKVQ